MTRGTGRSALRSYNGTGPALARGCDAALVLVVTMIQVVGQKQRVHYES